jgi:hypothetical protein
MTQARLIVHNPDNPHEMQLPLAVCSDERGTWIHGDDWILSLKEMPLSEVTQETVRSAMNASVSWAPVLSQERELPDYDWQSVEMLDWLQQWREETLKAARVPATAGRS